jgi:hypothetical protein
MEVIRRADTKALASADVPIQRDVYIQANSSAAEIQFGSPGDQGKARQDRQCGSRSCGIQKGAPCDFAHFDDSARKSNGGTS